MKKILHVIARNPNGGVGMFIKNTYHYGNNDTHQHDYLILTTSNKGNFEKTVPKSTVFRISTLRTKNFIKTLMELKALFQHKLNDYDVVHVHSPVVGLLIYIFSKKTKTILHSHSNKISDTFLKRFRNSFVTIPLKFLPIEVVACSETAGKLFKKNNEEVYIVNNGINTEKFAFDSYNRNKLREKLNLKNKLILGHVGTFTRVKNQGFLLELMVEIKKNKNDVVLILIGEGETSAKMKKKCEELSLTNDVIFLGAQSNIAEYLDMIDIFLLPSLFEGIPISLIEAQAKGLHCIVSTNVSEDAKIIDNLFHRISLSDPLINWSNKIDELRSEIHNRESSHLIVKQKGYEISEIIKNLNKYYSDTN